MNPSVYNPKDPIILFIIQVSKKHPRSIIKMLEDPGLMP